MYTLKLGLRIKNIYRSELKEKNRGSLKGGRWELNQEAHCKIVGEEEEE